jgi:hypothetical protein
MKKLMIIGTAVMLVVFASLQARAEMIMNEIIPFDTIVFVPCALDGVGEDVEFSGELRVLVSTTLTQTGKFHTKTHYQPMGVSGIGLTSGDIYQLTGGSRETTRMDTTDNFPQQFIWVYSFNVIGPGPGNNFTDLIVFVSTFNANGIETVSFLNSKGDCK